MIAFDGDENGNCLYQALQITTQGFQYRLMTLRGKIAHYLNRLSKDGRIAFLGTYGLSKSDLNDREIS